MNEKLLKPLPLLLMFTLLLGVNMFIAERDTAVSAYGSVTSEKILSIDNSQIPGHLTVEMGAEAEEFEELDAAQGKYLVAEDALHQPVINSMILYSKIAPDSKFNIPII